ncbi:GvpL/GvpF family gas vesicle protein [Amycolatopsis sp. NBC_00438]|uniref:GvpL/GvpF family gas vesicle protein n=1 Tax=Amycolatopsis sp. NBC_00438 TaxID=2903558 RepID=UPI002E246494
MTAGAESDADVASLAQRHAPEVWETALRAAKDQATAVLTRRLTDAILAGAAGPRSGPAPGPDIPQPRPGLCAYAITWSHAQVPENVAGSDVAPAVRLIVHENLALLVAQVDLAAFAGLEHEAGPTDTVAPDSRLAMLARQHDAVIRAIFHDCPALPLRFGTVVRDERAALRLLEERRAEVAEWLARVDGHREWGVRVVRPEPHPESIREVPLEGISGTEYLALRARQLDDGRHAKALARDAVNALHDSLAGCSTDAVQREQPHAFFDAAYLVRQDQEETFHGRIRRLEDDLATAGMTARTTGPWPPYSFAPAQLEVRR